MTVTRTRVGFCFFVFHSAIIPTPYDWIMIGTVEYTSRYLLNVPQICETKNRKKSNHSQSKTRTTNGKKNIKKILDPFALIALIVVVLCGKIENGDKHDQVRNGFFFFFTQTNL